MLMVNELIGFGAFTDEPAAAKVLTFQGSNSGSTYTNAPIGTAASDRIVFAAVSGAGSGAGAVTGVTFDGVAGTLIEAATNSVSAGAIYACLVPTGTTCTIVVSFATGKSGTGIGVWTATGLASLTPVDTKTSTTSGASLALTTVAGGFAIGLVLINTTATMTWSGTDDVLDYGSSQLQGRGSGAHAPTASTTYSMIPTSTFGSVTFVAVAASF